MLIEAHEKNQRQISLERQFEVDNATHRYMTVDAMVKVGNRRQYYMLPLALLWFQSHQHDTWLFQVKWRAQEITAVWMPEYDGTS